MLNVITHGWTSWRVAFATLVMLLALTPVFARAVDVPDCDPAWVAPTEQASKPNPLASRTDAAAGGAKLFRQRCATCHGEDGHGTAKAPDLTQPDVQAQSDGALFWKISSGNTHHGMPTFSFLPESQRWQLVLQLRALGTVHLD